MNSLFIELYQLDSHSFSELVAKDFTNVENLTLVLNICNDFHYLCRLKILREKLLEEVIRLDQCHLYTEFLPHACKGFEECYSCICDIMRDDSMFKEELFFPFHLHFNINMEFWNKIEEKELQNELLKTTRVFYDNISSKTKSLPLRLFWNSSKITQLSINPMRALVWKFQNIPLAIFIFKTIFVNDLITLIQDYITYDLDTLIQFDWFQNI